MYHTYSAFLLSELLAPPLASLTMGISVWLSFIAAVIAMMLSLMILATTATSEHTEGQDALLRPGSEPQSLGNESDDGSDDISPAEEHLIDEAERQRESENQASYRDNSVCHLPAPAVAGRTDTNTGYFTFVKSSFKTYASYKVGIPGATAPLLFAFLVCPARQILVFEILIPYTSRRFALKVAEVSHVLKMSLGIPVRSREAESEFCSI